MRGEEGVYVHVGGRGRREGRGERGCIVCSCPEEGGRDHVMVISKAKKCGGKLNEKLYGRSYNEAGVHGFRQG